MRRRTFALTLIALPVAFTGCSSTPTPPTSSAGLVDGLTSQLGVTPNQAVGGVGSMLTLAQEKLSSGQFDQIAKVIPGADKYLNMAKSLGAVTAPLGGMAGLTSAMGKLGISPETAAKFVPAVTNYVSQVGGKSVGNMLAGVFK